MTALRLLFLGRRRGALAAAERLGAEAFVLDDARPPSRAGDRAKPRGPGTAEVSFDDPSSCLRGARALLGARPPDAVIALVERAVVPAAALRMAYGVRGATPDRALLWRDKLAMKARIREAGLPHAQLRTIERGASAARLIEVLGLPMVLKPRSASGGRGTVIAQREPEVRAALREGWLAERFIDGVELSVESFVQAGAVAFENVTEYLVPGWANVVPAALPPDVDRAVRRLNRAAIEALEVSDGLTHLEAFVVSAEAAEPGVIFGELACRPPGGSLMELMQRAYGFDPWASHLAVELGRPLELPTDATRSAGVYFLHPGAGRVARVEGLDEARAVPGVVSVECRVEPGDLVSEREGVGQHVGRVLAETATRDATARALTTAHARVAISIT